MSVRTTVFDPDRSNPAEFLVVGAGPAGLACAIVAVDQRLQVELIDALAALGFDLNRDRLLRIHFFGLDGLLATGLHILAN